MEKLKKHLEPNGEILVSISNIRTRCICKDFDKKKFDNKKVIYLIIDIESFAEKYQWNYWNQILIQERSQ